MTNSDRILDLQKHVPDRLTAAALGEFQRQFRECYPAHIWIDTFGAVGPMQAFLGFMAQNGYIIFDWYEPKDGD